MLQPQGKLGPPADDTGATCPRDQIEDTARGDGSWSESECAQGEASGAGHSMSLQAPRHNMMVMTGSKPVGPNDGRTGYLEKLPRLYGGDLGTGTQLVCGVTADSMEGIADQ